MLLGTLGGISLESMSAGKGAETTSRGRGRIRTGDGTIREGHDC